MIELTVIIPTYNPNLGRLEQTLRALQKQTLDLSRWELIVVDNNSKPPFICLDLNWHPSAKVIKERRQGLTYARIKGFSEAQGNTIVLVDDDNVLDINYLNEALNILKKYPKLGAIGGRSLAEFEDIPPKWLNDFYESLAIRNFGDSVHIENWQGKYPAHAPIGAGMVIRKKALESYVIKIASAQQVISDRVGGMLSSGGDNDIVLEILKAGWQTGYFPSLNMNHLIPRERLSVSYVANLINNSNKSWIQLLDSHKINPWTRIARWTVPIRKIKAWFVYRAWQNNINYIRWRAACGIFDGLSA